MHLITIIAPGVQQCKMKDVEVQYNFHQHKPIMKNANTHFQSRLSVSSSPKLERDLSESDISDVEHENAPTSYCTLSPGSTTS